MSRKHGFPDECDCASEDICQFLQRREEREQAMTDTPTPGEAAALPVAWFCDLDADVQENPACLPYVRLSDAQAIIDRQAAELVDMRTRWNAAEEEFAAHKAAALPTIEAIMGLVEACADETARDSRDGACESNETEAARESIRAALARALPVGESELLTVIRDVDRLLTNLQPHIEQACLPGHAGFIDNYVDPALEKLRGALPEWKAAIPLSPDRPAEGTKP